MKHLLEDKEKKGNLQAIKECFGDMFCRLFDSTSQSQGNEFGPFRKRFAKVKKKMKVEIIYMVKTWYEVQGALISFCTSVLYFVKAKCTNICGKNRSSGSY